jgi:hypothetical protein
MAAKKSEMEFIWTYFAGVGPIYYNYTIDFWAIL